MSGDGGLCVEQAGCHSCIGELVSGTLPAIPQNMTDPG